MVTATYRAGLVGVLAIAVSGCGSSASSPPPGVAASTARQAGAAPNEAEAGFAWLAPAPAPAHWRSARLATGATIAYPPDWHSFPVIAAPHPQGCSTHEATTSHIST
jgi:hypothetical protein